MTNLENFSIPTGNDNTNSGSALVNEYNSISKTDLLSYQSSRSQDRSDTISSTFGDLQITSDSQTKSTTPSQHDGPGRSPTPGDHRQEPRTKTPINPKPQRPETSEKGRPTSPGPESNSHREPDQVLPPVKPTQSNNIERTPQIGQNGNGEPIKHLDPSTIGGAPRPTIDAPVPAPQRGGQIEGRPKHLDPSTIGGAPRPTIDKPVPAPPRQSQLVIPTVGPVYYTPSF